MISESSMTRRHSQEATDGAAKPGWRERGVILSWNLKSPELVPFPRREDKCAGNS